LIPEGKKPSKKYNTEHPKKGDEYRDNTGKEFPKIPHISPKKVHKSTHYKKGVSPFHFVGFTEYLEQMSKQYKGLGKSDSRSGHIFGSKIVKKKWGCEGCRKVVAKLFQSKSLIYLKKLQLFIPQAI
jgi:hypothetical protein